MSVVIETTLGDITVDLYLDQRPVTCLNFLKLCKMKYYNFNLFHMIQSGFIAQTGDPTGEGSGGQSIWGLLEGPDKRFFSGEKMPKIRHTDAGLLSMVCTGDSMVGSQFFFTLAPDLDSLDGIHCVIGEVTEGHEVLRKLNDVICDETHRPYQDVRITHTVVLDDPFNDPPGLRAPSRSPSPSADRLKGGRIAPDEEIDETQGKSATEIQEIIEEKEAKARATILEIIGDLPDADIAPPENVLFVCKLNPVTTDEDLEIIFSRFGKIVSCEVIRDKKTGDSLQYAFIEFADKKSCEDAYFKMDNVLIDDRRIHVDFSQSVSKIKWLGKGRGVKHINDNESENKQSRGRNNEREVNKVHYHRKDKEYNNKRSDHVEQHNDKHHRYERRERNEKNDRERSRSKSKSKLDLSKERSSKDDRNYHSYNQNNSRNSEKIDRKHTNRNENVKNYREDYTSHKSSAVPTSRSKSNKSPSRHKTQKEYQESEYDKKRNNDRNSNKIDKVCSSEDAKSNKLKHKRTREESRSLKDSKKAKYAEPHTPSPVSKKTKDKKKPKHVEKERKSLKRERNNKRKRKPSTSTSETDSSESSSTSSDSSSSSDTDEKKKSLRKRRKKYSSTSSSETSSSSSNSTSSDSSSDSSSSDSECNKKRRHKKNVKKKIVKKSKRK